ncbi:hypothetical protein BC938DRAFT_475543 [Jimgerdemannia flammicorona]|uniref:Lysosomal cobalamin transporter n=1 Tax=Jimgerdemannia flammicorona TaxID=994334 RepID=A0A433PSP4_9FUNG|nr:hypothetical protein BC938DRAFT_475543 [Jimgerdemannia flammicorona]
MDSSQLTHIQEIVSCLSLFSTLTAFYAGIALFSSFIIPFAYFFFEEYEEGQPTNQRIIGAFRYTFFFIVINIVLLLFGLFLKPGENSKIDLDWFRRLISESSMFLMALVRTYVERLMSVTRLSLFIPLTCFSDSEKSMSFVIAVLTLAGSFVLIFYTAPGLSLLPFSLLKGRRRLDADDADLSVRIAICREKQRAITGKYAHSPTAITNMNRELQRLEREERILTRQQQAIDEGRRSLWQKVLKFLRPLEYFGGVILLLFSLVVIGSIFLTSIDKITNSICGRHCGYILSNPGIFNPINFIFVILSKVSKAGLECNHHPVDGPRQRYFPLDYIFMDLVIIYFFFGTITGIIRLGVRFMWVTLFKIRAGATPPQGLLFATILLMLSLLALNFSITTVVAPGYAHFGSQVYVSLEGSLGGRAIILSETRGTVTGSQSSSSPAISTRPSVRLLPLWLGQIISVVPLQPIYKPFPPLEICTPTVASTLIDRVAVNTPFFGVAFYYTHWAFIVAFLLAFIVGLCHGPHGQTDDDIEDLIEREEEQRLLGNERTIRPIGSQSSLRSQSSEVDQRAVRPSGSKASLRSQSGEVDQRAVRPSGSKASLVDAARSRTTSLDDV